MEIKLSFQKGIEYKDKTTYNLLYNKQGMGEIFDHFVRCSKRC